MPFIQEDRLFKCLQAIRPEDLTEEERSRNEFSSARRFFYQPRQKHPTHSSTMKIFPPVPNCGCGISPYHLTQTAPGRPQYDHFQLLPETHYGKNAPPLFPSLHWLKPRCYLANSRVNLFGYPTRRESLCLAIGNEMKSQPDLVDLGARMLTKTVFVEYPYCKQSVVESISTRTHQVSRENPQPTPLSENQLQRFLKQSRKVHQNLERKAIYIHNSSVLVYVRTFRGLQEDSAGKVTKDWNSYSEAVPLEVSFFLIQFHTKGRFAD